MSYIASPWNHLRSLRAWAERNRAEMSIDASTFGLEVRAHNRYFPLHPKFFARAGTRWLYANDPTADGVTGFAGWLPYRTVSWPLSADKRAFDAFARGAGLRRPRVWADGSEPDDWYLVKSARGSFGEQIAGPFAPTSVTPQPDGEAIREAFVPGRALKVWFWGQDAFFAHVHERPEVVGDGDRSVQALLPRGAADRVEDEAILECCLSFQGLERSSVPAGGKRVWVDFRYGRHLSPPPSTTSDDALEDVGPAVREQIDRMGATLWRELEPQFRVPLLCSVDGVLDSDQQVWWLEANSNPAVPPESYPLILGTLFPTPPHGEGARP